MTLDIKNIGMIDELETPIEFEGITVVAGNNNTGKSTISKILYCIFTSLYRIDNQVNDYVNMNIYRSIDSLLMNKFRIRRRNEYKSLLDNLHECNSKSGVKNIVLSFLDKNEIEYDATIIDRIATKISDVLFESVEELKKIVISNIFNEVFHSQINSIRNNSASVGEIDLCLSKKHIMFRFENDKLTYLDDDINVLHSPMYYDGPHIINDNFGLLFQWGYGYTKEFVNKIKKNNSMSYEETQAKDIIKGLFDSFNSLGSLNIDLENDTIELQGLNRPLNISNLSNGLKTIVLLKNLLESGNVIREDILILDEPEINLHPEWQLELAKILVELHKRLDLTLLISTHSPYFLAAIDTYSYISNVNDKCRYYLSTGDKNKSLVKNVSNEVDKMYESLSNPFNRLMEERHNFFNGRKN